jgi:hypothetical protein
VYLRAVRATLWVMLVCSVAHAGGGTVEGTVTVKRDGKPAFVKNALVYLKGFSSKPPSAPYVMTQAGRAFDPVVLPVVHKGRVAFSNAEPDEDIYHHVFSPSKQLHINSPKYKPKSKPYLSEELTTDGPFQVFCDIHKEMISTVYVVPNDRFTLLSAAEGDSAPFKIEGIPPGKLTIVAWHRSAKKEVELPIEVKEGQTTKIDLVVEGESGIEQALKDHKRLNKDYDALKSDGGSKGEAVGLEDDWK